MPDISFQYRPATPEETGLTARHLLEHSSRAINLSVDHQPFGLLAYDGDKLIGSVIGKTFFNWLHVDLFWVADDYRGQGLGTKLMQQAANIARQAGLDGIEVWTQSWQAPEFYRKLGYEEFSVIEDFTPGRKRHAFRLYLSEAARPPEISSNIPPLPEMVRKYVKTYFLSHGDTLPSSGIYDLLMPLFEKPLIEITLEATGGNQLKAAKILGINRNTLRKKIVELGITL